jgi:hypothetical protein
MGQVHPFTQTPGTDAASAREEAAVVRSIESSAHCALCGAPLGTRTLRYHIVSPRSSEPVTVCYVCRNAALSEGYRPAG